MFTTLTDYKTASQLAKIYKKKNGKLGVSRTYINELINKEHEHPNTTDIDVIMIDGYYFAKQKQDKTRPTLTYL